MGVARQSQKAKKKIKVRVVDVSGKTLYGQNYNGTQKHFNFRKREKDNMKGGLYYEEPTS